MTVSIPLGTEARVSDLYSFPNSPTRAWTLAETVKHWFDMTVDRDGLAEKGARVSVTVGEQGYVLTLDGPDSVLSELTQYATRLPQFLKNGEDALTTVVPKLKQDNWWDASPDSEPPPYHPWRFFLPHGMAMLNQKALLFFHYPPIRLLDTNQDYLDDPVPVRCEELLTANGVSTGDLPLFNTVMDATPIGAEDDQGSKKGPGIDPTWGCVPIQYFHDYQRAQVELLLNVSPKNAGYTVPIVVYGAHPLATFNDIYGMRLKNNQVDVTEIIRGKKTAVMASTHPYVFYGTAQGFDNIGSGVMVNVKGATAQMIKDLVVARWLKLMSDDPSQNPNEVLASSQKYWKDPAQSATVTALVNHQGSLKYSDPTTLTFDFLIPLPTLGQPAPSSVAAAPAAAELGSVVAQPEPAAAQPAPAAAATAAAQPGQPQGKSGPLKVIGDSGKPVDWWFIYKISEEAEITDATGIEYAYFDSEMAKQPGAKLVLSKNKIDGDTGALHDTLSPLFGDAAKANPNLGWFCYNDEDHRDPRGAGTGPGDRGHCKGVLAFDLQNKSAFWLIHSVPLFPVKAEFNYPDSGHKMAQTMLCIQLEDDDTAEHIAQLMYDAHGPNVNVVSAIPAALTKDDPRHLLMQDLNGSMKRPTPYPPLPDGFLKAPYPGQVPFNSKGGMKFHALAKNKVWGLDLYNDLVSKVLDEDLEVETWENAGKDDKLVPPDQKPGDHDVENMKSVNLSPLGIPYSWSEKVDHAKLALSDRNNKKGTDRWVCVGDINFTDAQEKRGGGTVAFQCEPLWNSLAQAVSDQPEPPKKKTSPGGKKPVASKKTPAATGKKSAGKKSASKKSAGKATSKSTKKSAKTGAAKKAPSAARKHAKKKSPSKRK